MNAAESHVERRSVTDRRLGDRRTASPPTDGAVNAATDRRAGPDRRQCVRRAADVPLLRCPQCDRELRYRSALSWQLPGLYTVDAGRCVTCERDFLRNRANGEYFEFT